MSEKKIDVLWDDNPVDVTSEANFIWNIANKLRGTYLPDKYGEVIIPMTILRRFECALEKTKPQVIKLFKENPKYPALKFERAAGYQFYCTSEFSLAELCNDSDHLAENFKDYISGYSENVQDIMKSLELESHIGKMNKGGCLLTVVKAFSELDLNPDTYDSIKMGYIFENIIGRFFQNVDAGQYYTGRDIIKLLVSVLTAEGCDDIFDDHKVITVLDQACGTGGMLSTAYSYLKHFNSTADVRLFGQEYMPDTHAIGLAEMLIKGQDARNFRHADTFKQDCFEGTYMRFVIENPPFGTHWSGEHAKAGQEEAVKAEFEKGFNGRWGAGLPSGNESQLIFMQSAINKMDPKLGRAAIIENGSPLFSGGTSSGESQIRRWILENDLVEAIIALPADLFYNTGIQTFVWILSKNKSQKRKGKVQLIDASSFCHRLRKPIGDKKNEILPSDRKAITELYTSFEESDVCKIFKNTDFIFKEYSIYQPLQRSYSINEERIDFLVRNGYLSSLYDELKFIELDNQGTSISSKDKKKMDDFIANKPLYDNIIQVLNKNVSDKKWLNPVSFTNQIVSLFPKLDKKIIQKIVEGLSVMDKTADIQKDKNGNVIYDPETKDTEFVYLSDDIESYMAREVLPHIPDAKAFFEENLSSKKPVIKTGAEIPFTRYFYKYEKTRTSEECLDEFKKIEEAARADINSILEQ